MQLQYILVSCQKFSPAKMRSIMSQLATVPSVIFFCFVTAVDQIVLDPVSCLTKMHYAAIFALRNGKFSRLGMTHVPLNLRSWTGRAVSYLLALCGRLSILENNKLMQI